MLPASVPTLAASATIHAASIRSDASSVGHDASNFEKNRYKLQNRPSLPPDRRPNVLFKPGFVDFFAVDWLFGDHNRESWFDRNCD